MEAEQKIDNEFWIREWQNGKISLERLTEELDYLDFIKQEEERKQKRKSSLWFKFFNFIGIINERN